MFEYSNIISKQLGQARFVMLALFNSIPMYIDFNTHYNYSDDVEKAANRLVIVQSST